MGAYVGRTFNRDGKGEMVGWRYVSGQDVLPGPDVVNKIRPKDDID